MQTVACYQISFVIIVFTRISCMSDLPNQTVSCMFILIRTPSHFLLMDATQAWCFTSKPQISCHLFHAYRNIENMVSFFNRAPASGTSGKLSVRVWAAGRADVKPRRPATCRDIWTVFRTDVLFCMLNWSCEWMFGYFRMIAARMAPNFCYSQ